MPAVRYKRGWNEDINLNGVIEVTGQGKIAEKESVE